MTSILYNLATGIISSTVNPSLKNSGQIAALRNQGTGVLETSDVNINGANAIVDIETGEIMTLSQGPVIPSMLTQYIAAQINSGAIPASAFHPATLSDINNSLSSASLATIPARASADVKSAG